MSLAGRCVLVAGAHDLAPSIARALVEAGARVILHPAPRNDSIPESSSVELLNDPLETVAQAEALAARCWASFGHLDGLVLAPAPATADTFNDTDEDWRAAIRAALKLPFFLARSVASRMAEAGGGYIVNVVCGTSAASLDVNNVTGPANLTMTQALAKALPEAVRVCAVVAPPNDPQDNPTGVARMICFLLSEESLPSGTIVHLNRS